MEDVDREEHVEEHATRGLLEQWSHRRIGWAAFSGARERLEPPMSAEDAASPGLADGDLAVPARSPEGVERDDGADGHATRGEARLDGTAWQIGRSEEVRWIADGTGPDVSIASAIPPIFDAYATLVVPEDDEHKRLSDAALLTLLRAHSPDQPWWLGYLETGASDVVFPDAPRVQLYSGWPYVLVKAGPDQAASWRTNANALPWHSALPELMFPLDQSWLVSTLWDDDWTCFGGPARLVEALVQHPQVEARAVTVDEDATPPGHRSQ